MNNNDNSSHLLSTSCTLSLVIQLVRSSQPIFEVGHYYHPHFTDEDTEPEREWKLYQVPQQISVRPRTQTWFSMGPCLGEGGSVPRNVGGMAASEDRCWAGMDLKALPGMARVQRKQEER